MSTKYTPEPWKIGRSCSSIIADGRLIAECSGEAIGEANAERIVECVNAMEGIDSPQKLRETWEAIKPLELDAYHKIKAERDELLQGLKDIDECINNLGKIPKGSILHKSIQVLITKHETHETE